MATSQATLQQGLDLYRAGKLDEAERIYRQHLEVNPRDGDARHLLGLIALARGRLDSAIDELRMAVECNPTVGMYHLSLGKACRSAGRGDEALQAFREAARWEPQSATAHNELGSALREARQSAQAEREYREAVRLDPAMAAAHNNLGNVLQDGRRFGEAIRSFQTAAALAPDSAEVQFNLGNCHQAQENHADAIAAYRRAIQLRPGFADAFRQLGATLRAAGDPAQAANCHREALRLKPDYVEALVGLGVALFELGQNEEAKTHLQRALALRPGEPVAGYNLAAILHREGRYDEAEALYRGVLALVGDELGSMTGLGDIRMHRGELAQALEWYEKTLRIFPGDPHATFGRAIVQLTQGNLVEGWQGYERRFDASEPSRNDRPPQPQWDGSSLGNKTLLVEAEGGLGDVLQFVRYVPLVRQRNMAARVVVKVPARLMPLLSSSGFEGLLADDGPAVKWDLCLRMMSLPRLFGTTLETIPRSVPYIAPRPDRLEAWRRRLAPYEGFKVGLAWRGNPAYLTDRHRSIPFENLAPLLAVGGVCWFSLQKGLGTAELAAQKGDRRIVDFGEMLDADGAFVDTAAIIPHLHLLITSDTALAHLAGAMGAPVWVALSAAAEWRWLRDRDDSPWYPTMRLFRQRRLDDWSDVLTEMANALARRIAGQT